MQCLRCLLVSHPLRCLMFFLITQATKLMVWQVYCEKKITIQHFFMARPMVAWGLMPLQTWLALMDIMERMSMITMMIMMVFGVFGMKNFYNTLRKRWMVFSNHFFLRYLRSPHITLIICQLDILKNLKVARAIFTKQLSTLIMR